MGRGDYIAAFDGGNGADRDGFLAGVKMRSAFDDVLAEQVENFLLEKANLVNGSKPVGSIIK